MKKRAQMAKRQQPTRGRTAALIPLLTVDFETALGALLRTPPPRKDEATDKTKGRKQKGAKKR